MFSRASTKVILNRAATLAVSLYPRIALHANREAGQKGLSHGKYSVELVDPAQISNS